MCNHQSAVISMVPKHYTVNNLPDDLLSRADNFRASWKQLFASKNNTKKKIISLSTKSNRVEVTHPQDKKVTTKVI